MLPGMTQRGSMLLGVCQTPVLRSREALTPFLKQAEILAAGRPALFLLPELFWGGFAYDQSPELLRETPELLHFLHESALDSGLTLAGSFWNQTPQGPENALFLLGQGCKAPRRIRAKAELFPLSVEQEHFVPDTAPPVPFVVGDLLCGACICFELRFPEYFRYQVGQGERPLDLLLLSSQWPRVRAEHLRALTRARAIENQCFVLSCNARGPSPLGILAGESCLVGPWGEIVFECGSDPEVKAAAFDPDSLMRARKPFTSRRAAAIALRPRCI